MLTIDAANVGAWAQRNDLGYTTYADLAARPEVSELIAEDVARANEDLPEAARVRRFVLLHKQLDADERRDHPHPQGRAADGHRTSATRTVIAALYARRRREHRSALSAMETFIQLTVNGLSNGAILALAALGFVLIYKATGVINFAQGEFLLIGAFVVWWSSWRSGRRGTSGSASPWRSASRWAWSSSGSSSGRWSASPSSR